MTETSRKILALQHKRQVLLEKLIIPSRAAAAQMKDAGMDNGSAPLLEILFQLDANEQERTDTILAADKDEMIESVMDMLKMMGGA